MIGYRPLRHAVWHTEPITFKDCVMPFFLLAMGISLTLSLSRRLQRGDAKWKICRKITLRSLIILALGLGLHLLYFVFYGRMRIPGVLQRLALVYFICGCVFLITNWRSQAILLVVLLVGYWVINVKGWQKLTRCWAAYGTSCIFVFIASHVLAPALYLIRAPLLSGERLAVHEIIYGGVFRRPWLSPATSSLLFGCGMMILWMFPLYFMYRRRIYIKV